MRARFGVAPTTSAAVCSVMIVCWAVASPLCGHWSDKLQRRKPIYVTGAVVAALGWTLMFYLTDLPLGAFVVLSAFTSFACGAVILGFAYAKESVPVHFLGTISGAVNFGNMLGPMLLQPSIGRVLDERWSGELANGLRLYSAAAFRAGFLLIIGWAFLTVILTALTRETHCRQAG